MVAATVAPDVQELLNQHDFLEVIETSEGETKRVRIKCQLTQHEMLPCASTIATHIKSKKFLKARDWYCHDYSQYEPYIVPHRRLPKCLYCNVTDTILNRIPSEVEKHVQGKRFKRMKQHVKIKVLSSKDDESNGMNAGEDFDADAFEFENQQVIYSDDDDDNEEEEEDEEKGQEAELEASKTTEEDDDMAVFLDDGSDKEVIIPKDEEGDEMMQESIDKTKKKRPAKGRRMSKKIRHKTKKAKKVD